MPQFRASAVSALIALLGLALPVEAAPTPIVFDFEDGMQGWTLNGSAQRVQTQILGGEWTIFGDGLVEGGASISIEMDLADIASISVEQFFVEGIEGGLLLILGGDIGEIFFTQFGVVESGNPSLRAVDVSFITGIRPTFIIWPAVVQGLRTSPIVAFIDNITFHPVPEPSTLGLLAFGFAALVCARRRM